MELEQQIMDLKQQNQDLQHLQNEFDVKNKKIEFLTLENEKLKLQVEYLEKNQIEKSYRSNNQQDQVDTLIEKLNSESRQQKLEEKQYLDNQQNILKLQLEQHILNEQEQQERIQELLKQINKQNTTIIELQKEIQLKHNELSEQSNDHYRQDLMKQQLEQDLTKAQDEKNLLQNQLLQLEQNFQQLKNDLYQRQIQYQFASETISKQDEHIRLLSGDNHENIQKMTEFQQQFNNANMQLEMKSLMCQNQAKQLEEINRKHQETIQMLMTENQVNVDKLASRLQIVQQELINTGRQNNEYEQALNYITDINLHFKEQIYSDSSQSDLVQKVKYLTIRVYEINKVNDQLKKENEELVKFVEQYVMNEQ